ncbi:NAD(P)H-dependent oxidoreductase [Planktotalea sp.]|uniref:NAD(P)H-dependent oxidoreductase n=2 Tax=Planktotalea sp. TaxID=2029877 RepID=UPI00344D94AB
MKWRRSSAIGCRNKVGSMHVLTILDHPNPKSFTAAAAEHFMQRAHAGGHPVELADLNAEGFNPLCGQWRT